MSDEAAERPGDFLRLYSIAMALLACVLGWLLFTQTKQKNAYAEANANARGIFGPPETTPRELEKPSTIRSLAVGIKKYLGTYKEATLKSNDQAYPIPMTKISDRAEGFNLKVVNTLEAKPVQYPSKGYEEYTTTVTFEATNLFDLARFLYNFEQQSTQMRILELKWDLKPERENPYAPPISPGHLVQRPTVRIGVRRPITSRTR